MSLFPATLALLLAAAFPQATPTSSSPTATFHSDVLHLDYTYSSKFTAMPGIGDQAIQQQRDQATGIAKTAASCISLPLTATDSSKGFRMIIILRIDGACIGQTSTAAQLGPLVTNTLTQSLKRFGDPQMGASADYEVAAHLGAVISGSVQSQQFGTTLYGTAACVLQGKDSVCWEFLASDCASLPELIAYPIHFDAQPAEPLIPARFAPPCKP